MAESIQQKSQQEEPVSPFMGAIRMLGALALFAALLVISISVIGRHVNMLLPGAVEIAEMLFVVVAACAMLFATVDRAHAATRLILDRLPARPRDIVMRAGLAFGALLCLAITAGNIWMLYDVWGLHEVSPLLEVPIVPFRIVFILASAGMVAVLFWQWLKGPNREP